MSNYQHIDLNYLNDLALGSNDFMEDMISSFVKTTPESISKMKSCLQESDWQQIGGISHKLKTSFSFMGMNDMVQLSKTLQDYGLNATNLDEIPGMINQMEEAYQKAELELKEELNKLKS